MTHRKRNVHGDAIKFTLMALLLGGAIILAMANGYLAGRGTYHRENGREDPEICLRRQGDAMTRVPKEKKP